MRAVDIWVRGAFSGTSRGVWLDPAKRRYLVPSQAPLKGQDASRQAAHPQVGFVQRFFL
jgi:hypothetical protein